MPKFGDGTELKAFVKRHRIISRWHTDLQNFKVFYAFVDKMSLRNRTILASIKKAS